MALLVIFAQLASTHRGHIIFLLAAYGWRNYFLYIPLAFLIGEIFQSKDLYRLVRYTLLLIIPISLLVATQFASAPDSIINSSIAIEDSIKFEGFRGSMGHVRPNGTFTSYSGQVQLVVSTIALALSMWLLPSRNRPVSTLLLTFGTAAVLSCLALSVTRRMFIHTGIVLLSSILAGFVLRGSNAARAWLLPAGLTVTIILLYPIVFPEGFEAFVSRWNEAYASESHVFGFLGIFGRAFYEFIDFVRLISKVPLIGFGMGMGGNASTVLNMSIGGVLPLLVAESDWSRHFVDMGPILAPLYILFRIIFVAWLGTQALITTRHSGNPLPVILFGYLGIVMLYDKISGHGSIGGYAWLFAGFLMAAINSLRYLQPKLQDGIEKDNLKRTQRADPRILSRRQRTND